MVQTSLEKPDYQQDLKRCVKELSIAYEELSLLYRVPGSLHP